MLRADVKARLKHYLNDETHDVGRAVTKNFVTQYKVCPELVDELLYELYKEGFKTDDGRWITTLFPWQLELDEEFSRRLIASRLFHTGEMVCPKF